MSLRFQFDVTSSYVRFRFDSASITRRSHWEFTPIPLRRHLFFIPVHVGFTTTSLRCYVDVTTIPVRLAWGNRLAACSDAEVGIRMLVGPSEGCSECLLDLVEGFGTAIGQLIPITYSETLC